MATSSSFSTTRFCTVFLVLLALLYVISAQVGVAGFLTRANAVALGHSLEALGYRASVQGKTVNTSRMQILIITECTGLYSMLILTSAILAYPAPVRSKLFGLLAGLVFIAVVNLFRLVTVSLVGYHWREWFHSFHVYMWQVTLLIMILLAWMLWMHWVARYTGRGKSVDAPADTAS